MTNKHLLHQCETMPDHGVSVVFGEGFGNTRSNTWHLNLTREATEGDLEENSILEEIGESIWSLCAEVRFCPYCGVDLHSESTPEQIETKNENADPQFGAFAMFDQEKWSGRLR